MMGKECAEVEFAGSRRESKRLDSSVMLVSRNVADLQCSRQAKVLERAPVFPD